MEIVGLNFYLSDREFKKTEFWETPHIGFVSLSVSYLISTVN